MNDDAKSNGASGQVVPTDVLDPATDEILSELHAIDEDLVFATGLEDAVIGYVQVFNRTLVLYDREKCLEVFMRDGCSYEEAVEHFDFNVVGAYAGERTPAFATIWRKPCLVSP